MPLYPSEARIVAALYGGDAPREMLAAWKSAVAILEGEGLPRRDPLFGNRRYWPAVLAYLQRRHGLAGNAQDYVPDGTENWV